MATPDEASAKRNSARRARRLAGQLHDDADRARLLAFADELEAAAEALEHAGQMAGGQTAREQTAREQMAGEQMAGEQMTREPVGQADRPGGRRRPSETEPTGN